MYGVCILSFFNFFFYCPKCLFICTFLHFTVHCNDSLLALCGIFVYFPPRLVSHQAAKVIAFAVRLRNKKY